LRRFQSVEGVLKFTQFILAVDKPEVSRAAIVWHECVLMVILEAFPECCEVRHFLEAPARELP
jgi:hypothetical protein